MTIRWQVAFFAAMVAALVTALVISHYARTSHPAPRQGHEKEKPGDTEQLAISRKVISSIEQEPKKWELGLNGLDFEDWITWRADGFAASFLCLHGDWQLYGMSYPGPEEKIVLEISLTSDANAALNVLYQMLRAEQDSLSSSKKRKAIQDMLK